jgi:hypothetical protein
VAGGSAVDRNSAGSANTAQYTSSAAKMLLSFFWAVRRPSNTHGKCSGHLEPVSLAVQAAFNCPGVLSTIPLDCGWWSARAVNDTSANLPPVSMTPASNFATSFASVVDTGGKFATGVYDTGSNNTGGKLPRVK